MTKLTRTLPAHDGPSSVERPLRLLIAEDEDGLRKALVRMLERSFEVTAVPDGASAAELLVRSTYDCVLSDIGLPGMTGVELLGVVRTYDLDVPVVLMTGQPSVESAVAAMELGAFTYVQKPFEVEALATKLQRAGRLARLARAKREAMAAGNGGAPLAGDRAGLNACFERALASLSMVFQPIVSQRSQKTTGFEALLRTREPSIPHPGAFLEVAQRLGRLDELGRRVREVVVAEFQPPEDATTLFVNLHPSDLLDPGLYDPNAPLSRIASNVVLEITERAALDAVTETKRRAAELRRLGFRIAIDDLGAGYAGLSSFATFEPEIVKLDMSLIRGIEATAVKRHVVESMVRLCRELDMRVVAEGIETVAELSCVLGIGCDYLQGYLLGRPGPALIASTQRW